VRYTSVKAPGFRALGIRGTPGHSPTPQRLVRHLDELELFVMTHDDTFG
jgi:hypothetical protein